MTSKDTNPKDALGAVKWRQFMTVPRQVLWELGVAMLEGALKYGRHNYRASGVRASVYLDAAYGHLDQFCEGEDIDKDSGLSHITKAMASLAVLRDAMMNDFWVDDRPPKIKDLDGIRDFLQSKVAENFERYNDKNPHHYTEVEDGSPYRPREFEVDANAHEWDAEAAEEFYGDFHDGPNPSANMPPPFGFPSFPHIADNTVEVDEPRISEPAQEVLQSLFGSFPPGYKMQVERVGDLELVRIAPEYYDWDATDEDFDNENILAIASTVEPSGSIEFTVGELQVGKTYQYHRNHLGDLVENGGIWTIKRLDEEGRPRGVKLHYGEDHRGVILSSGWWVQVGDDVAVRASRREQLERAQSSASVTAPMLGLSSHALNLLDGWRTEDTGQMFDAFTPAVARALALRQWAVSMGLI